MSIDPSQDLPIEAGQLWVRGGFHYQVRVMGVVEGYVVFRRKGAAAALETERVFRRDFVRCS